MIFTLVGSCVLVSEKTTSSIGDVEVLDSSLAVCIVIEVRVSVSLSSMVSPAGRLLFGREFAADSGFSSEIGTADQTKLSRPSDEIGLSPGRCEASNRCMHPKLVPNQIAQGVSRLPKRRSRRRPLRLVMWQH